MAARLSTYQRAFAHGVCSALAVIAAFDDEVQWREIVAANGGYDYLHAISRRAGNLRIDGFARYRRPHAQAPTSGDR